MTAPADADKIGVGWISLHTLARLKGIVREGTLLVVVGNGPNVEETLQVSFQEEGGVC